MLKKQADILYKFHGWPCAVFLAALSWVLAVSAVREKSNTFDEIAHLTAGYSYWTTAKYNLNTENGNLPNRLAALPLLASGCRFPRLDDPAFIDGDAWEIGRKFFFQLGNPLDDLLFRSHAVMALTGAALVLLVFFWSRSLWGIAGGLISAALTAFCPTVLANAPLVTSDAIAALFFLVSVGLIWRLLHRVSFLAVLLTGAALGCLALSKMSAPLIAPVALALCGIRIALGPPLEAVFGKIRYHICNRLYLGLILLCSFIAAGILAVCMIWAAFSFTFKGPQTQEVWAAIASQQEIMPRLAAWSREQQLLPEAYLYGFSYTVIMAKQRSAFLNGQYSNKGWPHFFIYSFLVKTPFSTLFLLLLAAAALLYRTWFLKPEPAAGRTQLAYRLAPLIVFLLFYGGATLTSTLNIGHRHLLPAYPALYILAGGIASSAAGRNTKLRVGVVALLLFLIAEMLLIWPNYIAYFNILAGGPRQAYKHLVDSSLDWGQDLRELQKWLAAAGLDQRNAPAVYLSYFGTAGTTYYDIKAELLPGFFDQSDQLSAHPLKAGVYCISATMLQCVYVPHAPGPVWLEKYEKNYRLLKQTVVQKMSVAAGAIPRDDPLLYEAVTIFRQLQFAKLCAYLRQREPDHQINFSILIYYLKQEEIDTALATPGL